MTEGIVRGQSNVTDQLTDVQTLIRQADELLKRNGFDIHGRDDASYQQSLFERRIWLGAYRNNSEQKKR